MKLRDCINSKYLLCQDVQDLDCIRRQNKSREQRYLLVMSAGEVSQVIPAASSTGNEIPDQADFITLSADMDPAVLADTEQDLVVVVDHRKQPVGIIEHAQILARLQRQYQENIQQKEAALYEYAAIVEHLDVDIFVTDGKGYILFLNPACERVCGFTQAEVAGKHVTELEKEHMISSSITMVVIETGKKTSIVQQMKTGKTVLSSAMPIFNPQGELVRVVSTSSNVAEINQLLSTIERQNHALVAKEQQLDLMREALFGQNNFACFSKGLEKVKETVTKIAPTELTVLIQGESGVGKEVAAKLIHSLSPRNKFPLVKINCGLIPENLIESELFGYEIGAFTGANKNGKIGKIELADQGTLFLDEIGEMPLHLQVKLLEFLQDREITRIGGTKRVTINTRIVAATNRDLKDMVQQGTFREDLFYRLNVFPIRIAPLRERKEDVLTFAEYFLQKFNDKYKLNKRLDPLVLDILVKYDWPGNVREFEHVIERAVVNSNFDLVTPADLNISTDETQGSCAKVTCSGLMPWKAAKKELEEQLIKRAYDYYKSTYKAAEALQVSQSTVAKIIKNAAK